MGRRDGDSDRPGSQLPAVRHSTFSARILGSSSVGQSLARSDTGRQSASGNIQRRMGQSLQDSLPYLQERSGGSVLASDSAPCAGLVDTQTVPPRSASLDRRSTGRSVSYGSGDVFDHPTAPVVDEESVQSTIAQSLELLATLDRDRADDATYPKPQAYAAEPRRQAATWQFPDVGRLTNTSQQSPSSLEHPPRGPRHRGVNQEAVPQARNQGAFSGQSPTHSFGTGANHLREDASAGLRGREGAFPQDPLDASVEQAIKDATLACRASADILANSRRRAGNVRHSASSLVSTHSKGHVGHVGQPPLPKAIPVRQSHVSLGTLRREPLGHAEGVPTTQQAPQGARRSLGRARIGGGAARPGRGRSGVGRSLGALEALGRRDIARVEAAPGPSTVLLPHGRTTVLTGSTLRRD
jgi:hypothetical protein